MNFTNIERLFRINSIAPNYAKICSRRLQLKVLLKVPKNESVWHIQTKAMPPPWRFKHHEAATSGPGASTFDHLLAK